MIRCGWLARDSAELVDGNVLVRNGNELLFPRLWTRDEYLQMSEKEWFQACKVELIGGEVFEMPAMYDKHLAGITLTADALTQAFGAGYWVRNQGSLDLSPHGVVDPDVAVIKGSPRGAGRSIPTTALLVVEVSESTLSTDRTLKCSLYPTGVIADYWIVNLVQRQLEVFRKPVSDTTQPFGWEYADRMILDARGFVAPLVLPQARVAVDELLP